MPGGLTDPISAQNVVNRFADYVRGAANSGISWGTNAYPFGEFSARAFVFGGDTNGKPIEINGNNLGGVGAIAVAQTVYNVLIDETFRYTRIRLMQAVLFVDGGGGNTGSRPTPGVVYNNTAVAHMNSSFQQSVSADRNNVFAGNIMTRGGTAAMFNNMRAAYNVRRGQSSYQQVNVCHASCHSNCHSSRGRR
jgi:hypothetical protein